MEGKCHPLQSEVLRSRLTIKPGLASRQDKGTWKPGIKAAVMLSWLWMFLHEAVGRSGCAG